MLLFWRVTKQYGLSIFGWTPNYSMERYLKVHHCAMRKGLTWWMSQWMSSSGTWTWWVFLSTVRLRWALSRSSFTVCQWKSSNRLPNDTRSCPPEKELIPENKLKTKTKVFTETIWNLLYNWLLLSCIKYLTYYITVWSLDRGSECFTDGQASNTLKVTLKIQITVTLCCSLFWENSQSLARLKDSHVLLSQRPCETVLSELLIFISLFENVIFLKINIIMDHPIMNSLSIFSYQKNPSYIPL